MKLWLFGADGQIGRAIRERSVMLGIDISAFDHRSADICDSVRLRDIFDGQGVIINAAAYTAVDRAETCVADAYAVNRDGARNLAMLAAENDVPFISLSTDYVFNGQSQSPWREDDPIDPLSVYGASKAEGEKAIQLVASKYILLRTSWVFSADGQNFVRTILRLSRERPELRIVGDQWGSPTYAGDIAAAIISIAENICRSDFDSWGLYHYAGAPAVTWHDFACAVLSNQPNISVIPIRTEEYPTPAKRPRYSVLNCDKALRVFNLVQPDWRLGLKAVLGRLQESEA